MRRITSYITFILFLLASFSINANAENGDWRIYASYHSPTKAIKVGTRYFVLASGNLYVYDSEDSSLGAYDKSNALSDFGIYDIAYNKTTKSLFILYNNGNIDIMNMNGGCVNMPELKNKTLNDKKINEVNITDIYAYISTNSGIVVVNMSKKYFESIYYFGKAVKSTLVSNTKIYAKTANEVYSGVKADNLLDATNWKAISDEELKKDTEYSSLKNDNTSDAEALKVVSKFIPDSPKRNHSYKLNMIGERLLVAGGNFYYPDTLYPATAMKYENNRWTAFDEAGPIAEVGSYTYRNICDIIQDPKDSEHHWIGTKRSGIYEFKNYKMVNHYTYNNSPLTDIIYHNTKNDTYQALGENYVRITGLQYDKDGNIWMLNNETDTIVRILGNNGKWYAYYYNEIKKFETFDHTMFDSRGWAWINSRRTSSSGDGSKSGFLIINTNGTIEGQKDDQHRFISTFFNQDGKSYTPDLSFCAVEDINGSIWIGNSDGLFMTSNPENVFSSNFVFTQIKIARNDGTNFADYLLSGTPVKCIAIDGGNRKWIGTVNNGVYLISADGNEIIEHFTIENSSLISDEINDIAINGKTGEVFIATTAGLCSYMGDAIDASETMEDNSLKVYPNPVRPEYSGDVHITGLMFDSNVKIVNAAGKLVYEGTSIGGEFSWNCCYKNGKRCSSGIYYALCTDENGKKGACTKILIVK